MIHPLRTQAASDPRTARKPTVMRAAEIPHQTLGFFVDSAGHGM